jgi:hypothetical protein
MSKQIREFRKEVLEAADLKRDHRFKEWCKWIDKVDPQGTNGYAFEGEFIQEGTTEVEIGRPRLILVSTCAGSRAYHTRHYRVLLLQADGTLECTDIATDDTTAGWALRIRDRTAALLDSLSDVADRQPDEVVITLRGRGLEDLTALHTLTLGASDYEIVQEALAAYRAELSHREVEP